MVWTRLIILMKVHSITGNPHPKTACLVSQLWTTNFLQRDLNLQPLMIGTLPHVVGLPVMSLNQKPIDYVSSFNYFTDFKIKADENGSSYHLCVNGTLDRETRETFEISIVVRQQIIF